MHNREHAWVTLGRALLATFCSFSQMQSVIERKHKAQVELLQLRISPDPKTKIKQIHRSENVPKETLNFCLCLGKLQPRSKVPYTD